MVRRNLRPFLIAVLIGVSLGLVSTGLAASDNYPPGSSDTRSTDGAAVNGSYNRVITLESSSGAPGNGDELERAEIAAFEAEEENQTPLDIDWELLPLD